MSVAKKTNLATNTSLIFSILMIAVLLVEYYDPQPPTKAHTYSHTSYVTALEVVPLKIYPLLINLWYKFSRQANPVGTFGFHFVIFSCFFVIFWSPSLTHLSLHSILTTTCFSFDSQWNPPPYPGTTSIYSHCPIRTQTAYLLQNLSLSSVWLANAIPPGTMSEWLRLSS